jgi:thiamine kinase-like enzyme
MPRTTNLLHQELDASLCYDLLPEWRGCPVEIRELSGGNTNRLYRATSSLGDVSIRIFGDQTCLYINREWEVEAIGKMADLGIGSRLIKYLPEKGVTIVEFIDPGTTLHNDHFLDPSLYPLVVEPIRKMHTSSVRLENVFQPFQQVRKMADLLHRHLGVGYGEFEIDRTLERLERIDALIGIPQSDYVACHNDLVAENFILIDAEGRSRFPAPVYIIDWEYAGMSAPYYDLADLFQEILLPRQKEILFLQAYCQSSDCATALYTIDLFRPFPDMYWFLWSLVQKQVSGKAFDFYQYGQAKYLNALKTLAFLHETYGLAV